MNNSSHTEKIVNGEIFKFVGNIDIFDYLGSGAYGVVCSAFDRDAQAYVAVKKCKNLFASKTIAKRTLRELRILRYVFCVIYFSSDS